MRVLGVLFVLQRAGSRRRESSPSCKALNTPTTSRWPLPRITPLVFAFLLGEVLEVNAVQAAFEQIDHAHRIFGRADVVPQVGTGADQRVVPLDGVEHVGDLVVAAPGP